MGVVDHHFGLLQDLRLKSRREHVSGITAVGLLARFSNGEIRKRSDPARRGAPRWRGDTRGDCLEPALYRGEHLPANQRFEKTLLSYRSGGGSDSGGLP